MYAGRRPQATALPCLVWRCTGAPRGEDLAADSGERAATFEIVVWAESLLATLEIKEALIERYHGQEGYDFGGTPALEMGSSRLLDEYDGDRVSDTYDDNGAFPLTLVLEFLWDE